MSDEKTALVPANHGKQAIAFRLVPGSLGEAMEMAKLIAGSDLCPKAYRGKPADCIVAYDFGAALGLSWMQALRSVAVVNGTPSVFGDAVPAIVLGSGQCERFHEYFDGKPFEDSYTAICIIKRKGLQDEIRREFSVADAKTAKIWQKRGRDGQDTPWITYPARMLRQRARGFAARDAFADKLSGLVLAEEAQDYEPIEDSVRVERATSPAVETFDRLPEAVRDQLEKGFEALSMSPAQRLVKLNEFLLAPETVPEEQAGRLLEWMKDEYAKRKTGQPRKAKDANAKHPVTPTSSVDAPAAPVGNSAHEETRENGSAPKPGASGHASPPQIEEALF